MQTRTGHDRLSGAVPYLVSSVQIVSHELEIVEHIAA